MSGLILLSNHLNHGVIVKQTQAFRSPFIHKKVVIAGDLDLDEYELANAVKNLGGFIQEEVGQDTDYVLVGDHDFFRTDVTELNIIANNWITADKFAILLNCFLNW